MPRKKKETNEINTDHLDALEHSVDDFADDEDLSTDHYGDQGAANLTAHSDRDNYDDSHDEEDSHDSQHDPIYEGNDDLDDDMGYDDDYEDGEGYNHDRNHNEEDYLATDGALSPEYREDNEEEGHHADNEAEAAVAPPPDLQVDSLKTFIGKNAVPEKTVDDNYVLKGLDPEQLSFKVACEIGTTTISLAKLATLKAGDCIEFMRWPNKVKLKLNDYLFAEGYLVEVEGMLGVKVTNSVNLPSMT